MPRIIAYTGGSLWNPKAGIPIIMKCTTYRTYHWKSISDAKYTDHYEYDKAKEEAEEWESRGYHVIVIEGGD